MKFSCVCYFITNFMWIPNTTSVQYMQSKQTSTVVVYCREIGLVKYSNGYVTRVIWKWDEWDGEGRQSARVSTEILSDSWGGQWLPNTLLLGLLPRQLKLTGQPMLHRQQSTAASLSIREEKRGRCCWRTVFNHAALTGCYVRRMSGWLFLQILTRLRSTNSRDSLNLTGSYG